MISINQPALKKRLNAAGLNLSGQSKKDFIFIYYKRTNIYVAT